jgi:hypothetical protein
VSKLRPVAELRAFYGTHAFCMLQEVNDLLGFQLLINILSNIVITVLFGYYFFTTAYNGKLLFYASIQVSSKVDLVY